MRELKPEEYFQVSGGGGRKGRKRGYGSGHGSSHGSGHGSSHGSSCDGGDSGGGGTPQECGPGYYWGSDANGIYGCIPF